jgi:hypothetical protein
MTKIGIVGHYSRQKIGRELRKDVGAEYLSTDLGFFGATQNHYRVWEHLNAVAAREEWCLVLEDDAIPVSDFVDQLPMVLGCVPPNIDVVSLYFGQLYPRCWADRMGQAANLATRDDACWIVGEPVLHGVAIAMTGQSVDNMLSAIRYAPKQYQTGPFDEAINWWCTVHHHKVAYCWPSIIQHSDVPTIIKHPDGAERESGRVAYRFGGRESWDTKSVLI